VPFYCYDFDFSSDLPALAARAVVIHSYIYLIDAEAPLVIAQTIPPRDDKICGKLRRWSDDIGAARSPSGGGTGGFSSPAPSKTTFCGSPATERTGPSHSLRRLVQDTWSDDRTVGWRSPEPA